MAPPSVANQQKDSNIFVAQARNQVVSLVNGLSRKNEQASVQHLRQLERQFGFEVQGHTLAALLDSIQVESLAASVPKDKDLLRAQVLARELVCYLGQPANAHRINQTVRGTRVQRLASILEHSDLLELTRFHLLLLGLVLQVSDQPDAHAFGAQLVENHTSFCLDAVSSTSPRSVPLQPLLQRALVVSPNHPAVAILYSRLSESSPSALFPKMLSGRKGLMAGLRDESASGSDHAPTTLAGAMRQAGYSCCATNESIAQFLKLYGFSAQNPPRTTDIASVLSMMMAPAGNDDRLFMTLYAGDGKHDREESATKWNVDAFIAGIRALNNNIDGADVFRQLDRADFSISDQKGFEILHRAFVLLGLPKFSSMLVSRWSHTDAQLSLLRACIAYLPEVFGAPMRQVTIDFDGLDAKPFTPQLLHPAFACLDLVNLLIALSETTSANQAKVMSILESAIGKFPELLLLGLAQVDDYLKTAHLRQHFIGLALPPFFVPNHPNGGIILPRLWHISKEVVAAGMVEAYRRDPACLSRLLDVAFELKGIMTLLESKVPTSFAVDFAILAGRREYLNLEKWLQDQLAQHTVTFYRGCLEFLAERLQMTDNGVAINPDSLSLLFKTLGAQTESIPQDLQERLRQLHTLSTNVHPRLANLPSETAGSATEGRGSFSPDVEEEANSYFQRVYKNQMTIDELVVTLQRFKSSSNQRELEIFACMIHNLFDEYRFFPKYPDKELMITGKIFGALVEHQLVSYGPLAIALRYVLDALRKPAGSKMFKFGVQALLQFRSRFGEWPQYCSHIMQIQHLKEAHPEIITFIETALSQSEHARGNSAHDGGSPPLGSLNAPGSPTGASAGMFEGEGGRSDSSSANPTSLLEVPAGTHRSPGTQFEDRIAFLMNNLSASTVEQSAKDLAGLVSNETNDWFAHYYVARRVASETNLLALYFQLIDLVKSVPLEVALLRETYRCVRVLIAADKATNSGARNVLKNLGTWLGLLTLSRNIPILHVDLSLKDVLLVAYDRSSLVSAIPFVCKVLEQTMKSKVFRPPNPWTTGVLRLLAELYHSADLRLNLKFEIEVLFKHLKIEAREIEPSVLLKNRRRNAADDRSRPATESAGPSLLPPELRGAQRLVNAAMEAAAVEIANAVVERSVKIACITTRELVLKDFAMEPDEQKMRKMAQIMASNLAMSLALVACKDPLRLSLTNHLRQLVSNGAMEPHTFEQTLQYALHDANLEHMAKYIEKQAQDRAFAEIDQELMHAYNTRKKHREKTGANYYDMSLYTAAARHNNVIPEQLRLKPNGLNPDQLRVYNDFSRVRTTALEMASMEDTSGRDMQPQLPQQVLPTNTISPQQFLTERFSQFLADADRARGKITYPLVSNPPDGELLQLIRGFMQMLAVDGNREEVIVFVAQRALLAMFDRPPSPNDPVVIACGFLLDRLTDGGSRLAQPIMMVALRHLDEGKHNMFAVVALIKARIMTINDLIRHFVTSRTQAREDVQLISGDFVARVILKVLVQDEVEAPVVEAEMQTALEYFGRMVLNGHAGPLSEDVKRALASNSLTSQGAPLFATIRFPPEPTPMVAPAESDPNAAGSAFTFEEWFRFAMDAINGETSVNNFLRARLARPMSDDALAYLLRGGLDKCFHDFFMTGSPNSTYAIADSFARMCALLVRHSVDPPAAQGATAPTSTPQRAPGRIPLLDKILAVVVLYGTGLAAHKKPFPQRTLARIFSSMMFEFNAPHRVLDGVQMDIMLAFGEALHALRPSLCPGWTFSWLELVSHRLFMPKILSKSRGWPCFQRLIVDLFKVMAPFIRTLELNEPLRHLYRGTLHVMLVLLHDFPEFLCECHYALCDPLPPSAIQLRNLVLSAFPRNMRLPDPFTPNLKVDLLPEINVAPRIGSAYINVLNATNLRPVIDSYLKRRDPSLLADLRSKLMLPSQDAAAQGTAYNVPLINALVLYVGVQAIVQLQSKMPMSHSPPMDIFVHLVYDLDPEGRYYLLNAIANQLRYPNSHTHFFSCVLLLLFADVNSEAIQEQITRVLLERLMVNRPHPWGLLITFIELIKNARYNFWSHPFVRCAPEIEWLFESVARSCLQMQPQQSAE